MIRQARLFLGAISFLSIIPTGHSRYLRGDSLSRAAGYFPAVGLLIGLFAAAFIPLLDRMFTGQITNALIVLFVVLVTGALHIDGLADTSDGLVSRATPEKRLLIMRDGASGPAGIAAVTMVLLIKFAMLSATGGTMRLIAVVVSLTVARWPIVILAWRLKPVGSEGLGAHFAGRMGAAELSISSAVALAATATAVYLGGPAYLALLPVVALGTLALGLMSARMVGGITGDLLGAAVETTEVLILAVFAILG